MLGTLDVLPNSNSLSPRRLMYSPSALSLVRIVSPRPTFNADPTLLDSSWNKRSRAGNAASSFADKVKPRASKGRLISFSKVAPNSSVGSLPTSLYSSPRIPSARSLSMIWANGTAQVDR